jgi:hypothetical protein
MSPRTQRNAPLRFARTSSEAFRDCTYGAAIERPVPRSMLASAGFWIGGLLSVGVWTLIWAGLAWFLENVK